MTLRIDMTTLARMLLVFAATACAVAALGPFELMEYALVPWDKAAHFLAFYGVTSLLFLSFPKRRRLDLAMLAAFGGCALEIMQRIVGRDAELGDIVANACGALAVVAPGYLEQARVSWRAAQNAERGEVRSERRRSALARLKAATPPDPVGASVQADKA